MRICVYMLSLLGRHVVMEGSDKCDASATPAAEALIPKSEIPMQNSKSFVRILVTFYSLGLELILNLHISFVLCQSLDRVNVPRHKKDTGLIPTGVKCYLSRGYPLRLSCLSFSKTWWVCWEQGI